MEKLIFSNLSLDELAAELAERVLALQKKTYQPQEPVIKDEYLNIKQAAELLNLAVATIYTMTCRKKIPYFKKGKKVYFKRTELEEWLNAGKKPVGEENPASARDLFFRCRQK